MSEFAAVAQLIDEARHSRAFPGCAVEVGRRDGVLWQSVAGTLTYEPDAAAVTSETIFDLASLTKVIATTPVAMSLVRSRRLLLTSPVAAYAPDWRGADRSAVTVADLLEHCAGLPAWWDLYRRGETRREFAHEISTLPLEYAPRSQSIYTDLGFILLGFILEDAGGAPLDAQFDAAFEHPDLLFRPPAALRPRIAPTADDRHWRKRLLVGEVEDENGWALGGIAGHAGVFGTAPAVGAYARLVLRTLTEETALGDAVAAPPFPDAKPRPAQLARARMGSRCARRRRADIASRRPHSATPASRACRCGSIRRRTSTSCC